MKHFVRFSVRISEELSSKIAYIAKEEGRSKNKEIEYLIRKHIESFERMHGFIKLK